MTTVVLYKGSCSNEMHDHPEAYDIVRYELAKKDNVKWAIERGYKIKTHWHQDVVRYDYLIALTADLTPIDQTEYLLRFT